MDPLRRHSHGLSTEDAPWWGGFRRTGFPQAVRRIAICNLESSGKGRRELGSAGGFFGEELLIRADGSIKTLLDLWTRYPRHEA